MLLDSQCEAHFRAFHDESFLSTKCPERGLHANVPLLVLGLPIRKSDTKQ